MDRITQSTFDHLTETDKRELQQFVVNQSQKSRIQSNIHGIAETCFKKCVTSKISSGQLESREESCLNNCVDRFMDANEAIVKHLTSLNSRQ